MSIRHVLIVGLSILLYSGCQLTQTTTAPSLPIGGIGQNTSAWSPCLVVQSPAGMPFRVQMDASKTLQRAGKLTWIRLNARLDATGLEYNIQARQLGMEIFSIVHLDDLEAAGWETAFDRLYATYPS